MVSVSVRALHTSSALQPSMSRSEMTARCVGGRASIASLDHLARFPSQQPLLRKAARRCGPVPGHAWPSPWKRSASTAGSSASSDEKGSERPSRMPRVFARFVRMRKIHVFSEERPSKRSIPSRTASQVSARPPRQPPGTRRTSAPRARALRGTSRSARGTRIRRPSGAARRVTPRSPPRERNEAAGLRRSAHG